MELFWNNLTLFSKFTAILKWFTSIHRQKLHHQEFAFWTLAAVKLKLFVLETVLHSVLKFQKTVSSLFFLPYMNEKLIQWVFFLFFSTIRYLCSFMCGHGQGFQEHIPNYRWRRLPSWSNHFPRLFTRSKCIAIGLRSLPFHRELWRYIPM